jgi:hypothetical protein
MRRYDPHAHHAREPQKRWSEDEEEPEHDAYDLFERESQLARTAGDPRWGTGGLPVEDPSYRRSPPAPRRSWVERPAYAESPARRASYARRERVDRGPYVGRGPRGYRRSDDRILEDVCEHFTEHGHLDPSDVEVTVRSGEVVLSGTVATRAEKRLAEDIADLVFGVVEVHNRLRVQRPGEVTRSAAGQATANGTMDR